MIDLTSPEMFGVCKAADVTTTIVALNSGAVETNPVMAGLMQPYFLPFILVSFGLYKLIEHMNTPALSVSAAVVTCAAALNNLFVIF